MISSEGKFDTVVITGSKFHNQVSLQYVSSYYTGIRLFVCGTIPVYGSLCPHEIIWFASQFSAPTPSQHHRKVDIGATNCLMHDGGTAYDITEDKACEVVTASLSVGYTLAVYNPWSTTYRKINVWRDQSFIENCRLRFDAKCRQQLKNSIQFLWWIERGYWQEYQII